MESELKQINWKVHWNHGFRNRVCNYNCDHDVNVSDVSMIVEQETTIVAASTDFKLIRRKIQL